MITYETIYIAHPDISQKDITGINEKISGIVQKHNGTVNKINDWGIRRLGYVIHGHSKGYYVHIDYKAQPDVTREIERMLQLRDDVLKQISVKFKKEKQ